MTKLLVAGGGHDANLPWIKAAADDLEVSCDLIQIFPEPVPELIWNLNDAAPSFNGKDLDCDCAFLRYDVFSGLHSESEFANDNAMGWFNVFASWCVIDDIFVLNKDLDPASTTKLAMLKMAQQHGFVIPKTIVTNSNTHLKALDDPLDYIAKPAAGGSYCISLDKALEETEWDDDLGACPALVQKKLRYPEFRVYRIGDAFFAYNIHSQTLDSRIDREGSIIFLDIETFPKEFLEKLKNLTDDIKCDFCAIDIKTDPKTKELVFLELNNGLMFMGYDKQSGGQMAKEMVRYLVKNSKS